jgi:uncharacterized alpha-E superfamily protein
MLLPEEGELPERLLAALLGEDWSFSLRSNLQRLQWAASQVRGKLSRENWQALVELQREAWNWKPRSRTSASCWISSTGW